MPTDPQQIQRFIADERFQALAPVEQLSTFRQFLGDQDPEFKRFSESQQQQAASALIQSHAPNALTTLGNVAESFVPIVGGAVRGAREAAMGEPLRPLTSMAVLGAAPTSTVGMAGAEAFRDALELGATFGLTGLARPAIGKLATAIGGGLLEGVGLTGAEGAEPLVARALTAPSSQVAEQTAGQAARTYLRTELIDRGLTDATAGVIMGTANAIERGIAGGEQEPLQDFVYTPLGMAGLGMLFHGVGQYAQRFGNAKAQEAFTALGERDPQRVAALQQDAGKVVEAISKTSGGALDRSAAADLAFEATQGPLRDRQDIGLLKETLRAHPDVLNSELGLHLLRTQRDRLTTPELTVASDRGSWRVTYDDADGRTITEEITNRARLRDLGAQHAAGDIVLDSARGPQGGLAQLGDAAGVASEVEPVRGPGGGVAVVPRGQRAAAVSGFVQGDIQGGVLRGGLPAPIPQGGPLVTTTSTGLPVPNPQVHSLVMDAERESMAPLMFGRPMATRSAADLAASPEAINRLRSENTQGLRYVAVDTRSGAERVLPGTVDRIDTRPQPYEITAQRDSRGNVTHLDSGNLVLPRDAERTLRRMKTKPQPQLSDAAAGVSDHIELGGGDFTMRRSATDTSALREGATVRPAGSPLNGRVVEAADPLGRVTVDFGDGRMVKAHFGPRGLDVDPELIQGTPPLQAGTVGTAPYIGRQAQSQSVDALLVPGQVLTQTERSLNRVGVRRNIEIVDRRGDMVTARQGEATAELSVATLRDALLSGDARALRGDLSLRAIVEDTGEKVVKPIAADLPASQRTAAKLAEDEGTAYDIRQLNRSQGQHVGPATEANGPAEVARGVRDAQKARERIPEEERTKGGNEFVKGCRRK